MKKLLRFSLPILILLQLGSSLITNAQTITGHPSTATGCVGASFSFTAVASATQLNWQVSTTGLTGTFTDLTDGGSYLYVQKRICRCNYEDGDGSSKGSTPAYYR